MISILAAFIEQDDVKDRIPIVGLDKNAVGSALQIVFGLIAVVAVIFIILNAIRYQTSLGNPEATAKLRDSIIWLGVGLAFALSAEAIVTFVLRSL